MGDRRRSHAGSRIVRNRVRISPNRGGTTRAAPASIRTEAAHWPVGQGRSTPRRNQPARTTAIAMPTTATATGNSLYALYNRTMRADSFSAGVESSAAAAMLAAGGALHAQNAPPAPQTPAAAPPAGRPGTDPSLTGGRHPAQLRHHLDRRDRPRQQGPVHRRPEEGRLRSLRGRREAGRDLVPAHPRRPRLQRSPRPAAAADGRHHPAGEQADQRCGGADLADFRRRPAPGLSRTPAGSRISSRRSRTSWCTKGTCSASSRPGRRRSRST